MRRSGIHLLACTIAMICGLTIDAARSPGVLGEMCAQAPAGLISAICAHFALLPATLGLMAAAAIVLAGVSVLSFAGHSVSLSAMWRVQVREHMCCLVLMGMGMFAALWAGHHAAVRAGAAWTSTAMIAAMLLGMAGGALAAALSCPWSQRDP